MSKATRVILVLGTIVLTTLVLGTCVRRSSSRKAVAKYKSDLQARGEKLTCADLGYPREPESGDHLDRLLSNARRLKFYPGSLALQSFIGAVKSQVCWQMPQPLPDMTWEDFSEQFVTSADAVEAIRQATQKPPRYFFHNPTNWANPNKGPFVEMRTAAQWLSGDAIAALHAGQLARAQADIHALTQLAQFNREDLMLVSQMIRVGIAGLGLAVTWGALQAEGWSEESLAAMQKDWEALDLADAGEKGMLGERAVGEAAFAHLRSLGVEERSRFFSFGGPSGNAWNDYLEAWVSSRLWWANSYDDERFFLEFHQHNLDSIRKLKHGSPWPEVDRELQSQAAELNKFFSTPLPSARYLYCRIGIPNFALAARTCVRSETQRRLTVTAIALERYKLRHGSSPPELDALVPQFLAAVPVDPMSARPLGYRRNTDGSFTLYSAGEDGRDDGGDPNPQSGNNKFDLWGGKDAVWPSPAR